MYQNLKFCLSEKEGEDTRSVHFLTFPVVKKYYFNPEIERKVGRMNKVIDLGRSLREKKLVSLKTPLRELVIVHHEAEYLQDLKSLENYIIEELNIKTLVLTSDQATHGVKYNLTPEHKTLGQKYKKEYPQMRKQLLALTDAQISSFVESGALELGGITLGKEELVIGRYLDTEASSKEATFDKDVVVLLDCTLDEELMIEGVCREIVNRVQRLRKKSGFEQTDVINYFYTFEKDDCELAKAFMKRDVLYKSLKQDMTCGKAAGEVISEELQEVNGNSFVLVLVK
jgi:isoleucyl-tRNA synthetase